MDLNKDAYGQEVWAFFQGKESNEKRGRMPGQIRIRIRFKKYIGDWFDYLLVSKGQMKDILKGTGWKVRKYMEILRSFHSPGTSDSPRHIK